MGYIGICGPKGYGFLAALVRNWVSVDFDHFGFKSDMVFALYSLKLGMVFRSYPAK